jgi:hypothetical protein
MPRFFGALLFALVLFNGRQKSSAQALDDAFRWDVRCQPLGCTLFLDVLHGSADEKTPPNSKDSRQYISLMVAVDRATRMPAYLAFHFPPDADQKPGFFIAFAYDTEVNGRRGVQPDPDSMNELGFDSCDADSCVARMREGKVDDGKGGFIDLLRQFNTADHLWLMYTRKGKPIRTMIPLRPFKTAYQRVMSTDLAPQE